MVRPWRGSRGIEVDPRWRKAGAPGALSTLLSIGQAARAVASSRKPLVERRLGRPPVHRPFRWKGYWACLKNHAPSGAPVLALYPSPAPRRPIRTQLGSPKSQASGPRFLQPCTRLSREPPHSLPIVPPLAQRRYYGEAMVCIWRVSGGSSMSLPGSDDRLCLCNCGSSGVSKYGTLRSRTARNAVINASSTAITVCRAQHPENRAQIESC